MKEAESILRTFAKILAPMIAEELKAERRDNPDELLPPSRIAKILRMRVEEVNRLIDSGALPCAPDQPRGRRRVKRSEVADYGRKK